MNKQTFKKNIQFLIRILGSLKLTVFCLSYLIVLILLGTYLQSQYGIFFVQENFFKAWFFRSLFIPFPALYSIMAILILNITCGVIVRYRSSIKTRIPLFLVHTSLFLFCLSGLLKNQWTQETHITLKEGESVDYSSSYHHYELAIWSLDNQGEAHIQALPFNQITKGKTYKVPLSPFSITIQQIFPHSIAQYSHSDDNQTYSVQRQSIYKNPEKNIPSLIVNLSDQPQKKIELYGLDPQAQSFFYKQQKFYIQLRHQHFPLPFSIQLNDVIREVYPYSSKPKTFQSHIIHQHQDFKQPITISMNNPFHFKKWTLYQSGYEKKSDNQEISTLALVYDPFKSLPYYASIIFLLSFLVAILTRIKRLSFSKTRKENKE